ncbi:MAG: DUF1822 family protein [Alkalinema sp. RU_4_3]|nr:DUF1822 family protein [Alkalinema sp. RU_4_3]
MSTQYFDELALAMPLTQAALEIADRFAEAQPEGPKRHQVRDNTLAVQVVADYLNLMGIPTDSQLSDSWNPVLQLCSNVADLEIPGLGRLECRPVDSLEVPCSVPIDVWDDRIGYVVVYLDRTVRQEGLILGFVPQVTQADLPLDQLDSIEALLGHLFALRTQTHPAAGLIEQIQTTRTKLTQWLDRVADSSWQAIDSLLSPAQLVPVYAVRSDTQAEPSFISQAKLLALNPEPVVLVVGIAQSGLEATVRLQVLPLEQNTTPTTLPNNLRLQVLDGDGNLFLEAVSGEADRGLQLVLNGVSGEVFSVQVECLGAMAIAQFEI